jgi:hypothetical protein
MIETLEKIFGSAAKVKIMRLFLFNPTEIYDLKTITDRAKVTASIARREVNMMHRIGLIKKRSFSKEFEVGKGKKKQIKRRRTTGWVIDNDFEYLKALQELLIQISPLRNNELLRRLSKIGRLKLIIVSGVFINNHDSRIDLLVVGDVIKKKTLENVIKTVESEIGREIRYTYFETADFQYRLGIYDKLIRDILEFPHEKILDKLDVSMRITARS